MSDDMPQRRWEDITAEISRQVPPAVTQALTPYRLIVEETQRDVSQLKTVVFGSPALGIRGMVERMGAIEGLLRGLLDAQEKREEDWKAMRVFLDADEDRQAVQKALLLWARRAAWGLGVVATVLTILGALVSLGILKV